MSKSERVAALRFPVQAELAMPGSKSHANRAIVCACLAEGQTIIRNATPCDDVVVMVENVQKMGFRIEWVDRKRGELKVIGGMEHGKSDFGSGLRRDEWKMENDNKAVVLNCHNAGTTLRFLLSIAALVPGMWMITGDERMRRRPIGDLVSALRSLGAGISDTNGCPPVTVRGGTLKGGSVRLKTNTSSQYLTSLLLIAPMLKDGLRIELEGELWSSGYIDVTEKVMRDFGRPHPRPIPRRKKGNIFFVRNGSYVPPDPQAGTPAPVPYSYDIEGDWSAAGAWIVLNELTGSRITFSNLRTDSLQSDRALPTYIAKLRTRGDVTIDCSSVPDQIMNLAVLAAFRSSKTTITGVANLRHKECDRLAVITNELRKAGTQIEGAQDELILRGRPSPPAPLPRGEGGPQTTLILSPHNDHRMAMCFAILGLLRGDIEIKNSQCVAKSYPQFFDHLRSVALQSRPIAVVGMRGAGKSGLARRLASLLKLTSIDIDKLFESRNGPIRHFIAQHGWPEFRRIEEELTAESLKPGCIVSLGGGATESAKTRALLKKEAIVIWIQATKAELIKRLKSAKRPALTDLPLADEVQKLMVERGPHYREVATIIIESKLPFSRQGSFVIRELKKLVRSPSSPTPSPDGRRGSFFI